MDVMQITQEHYTSNVCLAAYMVNPEATKQVEKDYQQLWDSGAGFTLASVLGRTEDSDVEINACAYQIQEKLKQIVRQAWVSQYTKEEMLTMLNLIARGPEGNRTRIWIMGCIEVSLTAISLDWNNANPEQDCIWYNSKLEDWI